VEGQVLKGHLEMLVLAVVGSTASHGYAVIERLKELSGGAFDLPEGTVYPVLHRLENRGLLSSKWSDDARRARRVYSVTAAGRRFLGEQRATWSSFSRAVSAVLRAAP
jgi:PadR family transcriptional regulator, regulatory protein PadR